MLDPATAELRISNQRDTWPHVSISASSIGLNAENYMQLVNIVFEGKRSKSSIKGCWDRYLKRWRSVRNIANHTGGGDGDDPATDQTTPQGAEQHSKIEAFKRHWIYRKFEET
jgi:hypothetical protein